MSLWLCGPFQTLDQLLIGRGYYPVKPGNFYHHSTLLFSHQYSRYPTLPRHGLLVPRHVELLSCQLQKQRELLHMLPLPQIPPFALRL